jgi:hypothetical protein
VVAPRYRFERHTKDRVQDSDARLIIEESSKGITRAESRRTSPGGHSTGSRIVPWMEASIPEPPSSSRQTRMSARAEDYLSDEDYSSDSTRRTQSFDVTQARKTQQSKPQQNGSRPVPLPLVQAPRHRSIIEDVMEELETLKLENERLRKQNGEPSTQAQPGVLAYTSKILHSIGSHYYLDEPRWEPTDGGSVVLLANNPIRNIDYYLDQHPEIAFAIYKEYSEIPPADRSKIETTDGIYRSPKPSYEFITLIAPAMLDAVEELVQQVPRFGDYFPFFDPDERILAPYLFMYYIDPFLPQILPKIDISSRNLVKQLVVAIEKSHGYEYASAVLQAEKGKVARHLIKYMVRPGDVLVEHGSVAPQAYIATGWIENPEEVVEESHFDDTDRLRRKRIPRYGPLANSTNNRRMSTYSWEIPAWFWKFDGVFSKVHVKLYLYMSVGYDEESVNIKDLNICPLQHAEEGTRRLLEKRGETFWSLRNGRFVSYLRSDSDGLHNVRYAL